MIDPNPTTYRLASLALTCGLIASSAIAEEAALEKFTEADRLFTLKVQPLLAEKCNGCHGADVDDIDGDYNMLTREGFLAGGYTFGEEVVVVGDASKSFLMEAIRWTDPDYEMPPKENDRLTEEQVAYIEEWINLGAAWPSDEVQLAIREASAREAVNEDGMIVQTSGGLGDDWTFRRYQPEDIWAFLPFEEPELPSGDLTGLGEGANPVDSFIRAQLVNAETNPAPKADPMTLLRRASYGLTGLPPTPKETAQFKTEWAENADQAWKALIDRLLDSPDYGERWAQHWLDVARYADTGGMSNDYERSNAWRYRDYVIRSFNEDKPYDDFIIEQIAGDELADLSVKERKGEDQIHSTRLDGDYTQEEAEWIVAASFLRMGAWDNAMVKQPEARQIYLDDVVNSVGQTFLATTMRCVKCHDHKFDPIPTQDYYRMYSVFASTQMAERNVPFLEEENLDGMEEVKDFTQHMHDYAVKEKNKLIAKREHAAKEWYQKNHLPYFNQADRKDMDDEVKPPRHVGLNITEQGQLKVREQDDWVWKRRLQRTEPMANSVYSGTKKNNNGRGLTMDKDQDTKWRPENFIYTGGALEAVGDPVTPGVLSALGVPAEAGTEEDPWAVTEEVKGRRLQFANWIADERNPITARAFVNRVWQQHFGQAIAGNPNNFGVSGKKPTHPDLLNWLAADFMENGWTLKRLHRLIMTSETYMQASYHPEREYIAAKDPDNELLAFFPTRRLTAEEMRDSFLAITGELEAARGGLPINPEINMEVALQPRMIQFSLAPAYQPDPTPEQRNRRTIYAYRVRGMPDPFLELFNQPNPNDSCEFRDSAAVSPQAFTLLNSDMLTDRSIAFAKDLRDRSSDLTEQIHEAFRRTLGRAADPIELERLSAYYREMVDYHADVIPEVPDYPTKITRSLVEEFSGEIFEYEEILPKFENYQPDLKASDVDVETRALADVCLLLFNTNEFSYVY
ncbi:MAG: PSD1 and planctomycete cytochrome C domain-containing protein [Verrucomicrobiota bacterium]